jgi:gas vesicle protein
MAEFKSGNNGGGSAQSFLVGAAIGGAVGAALALLYAPKKGSDLREDIVSKVGDVSSRFRSAIKNVKDSAEEIMNEGKERGDRVVQEAVQRAEDLIDEADRLINEARSRIGSL